MGAVAREVASSCSEHSQAKGDLAALELYLLESAKPLNGGAMKPDLTIQRLFEHRIHQDEAGSAGSENVESTLSANQDIVSQLANMGFNYFHCQKAAINTSNAGVEEAMNWLLSHMDDPDVEVNQSQVETLISFGFGEEVARKALKASVISLPPDLFHGIEDFMHCIYECRDSSQWLYLMGFHRVGILKKQQIGYLIIQMLLALQIWMLRTVWTKQMEKDYLMEEEKNEGTYPKISNGTCSSTMMIMEELTKR
ncbi:hypothetical protein Scep_028601 [Stephania cephalantha]|uniref:ubiquitinyl hydrolase 1 n=1 Tax=Stephania cephalantha TaxID=152367 RepID=A0AAP0HJR6_9MAGN